MPMTDAEFYGKMFAIGHKGDCSWGWDQYWWECDCGLIPVAELQAEKKRRALAFAPALCTPTENAKENP